MIESNIGGWFTAEDYYALQDKVKELEEQVKGLKEIIGHDLHLCVECKYVFDTDAELLKPVGERFIEKEVCKACIDYSNWQPRDITTEEVTK